MREPLPLEGDVDAPEEAQTPEHIAEDRHELRRVEAAPGARPVLLVLPRKRVRQLLAIDEARKETLHAERARAVGHVRRRISVEEVYKTRRPRCGRKHVERLAAGHHQGLRGLCSAACLCRLVRPVRLTWLLRPPLKGFSRESCCNDIDILLRKLLREVLEIQNESAACLLPPRQARVHLLLTRGRGRRRCARLRLLCSRNRVGFLSHCLHFRMECTEHLRHPRLAAVINPDDHLRVLVRGVTGLWRLGRRMLLLSILLLLLLVGDCFLFGVHAERLFSGVHSPANSPRTIFSRAQTRRLRQGLRAGHDCCRHARSWPGSYGRLVHHDICEFCADALAQAETFKVLGLIDHQGLRSAHVIYALREEDNKGLLHVLRAWRADVLRLWAGLGQQDGVAGDALLQVLLRSAAENELPPARAPLGQQEPSAQGEALVTGGLPAEPKQIGQGIGRHGHVVGPPAQRSSAREAHPHWLVRIPRQWAGLFSASSSSCLGGQRGHTARVQQPRHGWVQRMAARRSQELLLRDEGHPLHVELRGQELVRRLGVPHAQEAGCPRGVVDLSLLLALLALTILVPLVPFPAVKHGSSLFALRGFPEVHADACFEEAQARTDGTRLLPSRLRVANGLLSVEGEASRGMASVREAPRLEERETLEDVALDPRQQRHKALLLSLPKEALSVFCNAAVVCLCVRLELDPAVEPRAT